MEFSPQELELALSGDEAALTRLVGDLTPVLQSRVARALLRWGFDTSGRNIRQEVEDQTQEVFAALFADKARILRSWDPARGSSLKNFVGLVAYRQTLSVLKSRKHSPLTEVPTQDEAVERRMTSSTDVALDTEQRLASREALRLLYHKLDATLSPLGRQMFDLLFVEALSTAEVCDVTEMKQDAVYAWRSRLSRQAREMMEEITAAQPCQDCRSNDEHLKEPSDD